MTWWQPSWRTGPAIPVGQMLEDEIDTLAGLPARLQERVIGQPHALERIAERVMVSRAGLGDPNKPVGVLCWSEHQAW